MGNVRRINESMINERFQRNQSMINESLRYGVRKEWLPECRVDEEANCLVLIFHSSKSKPLYCQAVRYLTREYLDEKITATKSSNPDNPAAYFGKIISKKIRRLQTANIIPLPKTASTS